MNTRGQKNNTTEHMCVCARKCVCVRACVYVCTDIDCCGKITGPLLWVSGFYTPTGKPARVCVCMCVYAHTCGCLGMNVCKCDCKPQACNRCLCWTQKSVCVWDLIASFLIQGLMCVYDFFLIIIENCIWWCLSKQLRKCYINQHTEPITDGLTEYDWRYNRYYITII